MNEKLEDVVLIKVNKSYEENMTPKELYNVTSFSWVASFKRTNTRDLKYYCAVYQDNIIEVYDFIGYEEEIPQREPPRYILEGKITSNELRSKLVGLDVSNIHKGRGNPIKYTTLETLLNLQEDGEAPPKLKIDPVDEIELITHIQDYVTSRGFNYSIKNIKNLYLSLRSKPFVIITGISGTGKTKIVQLFAESIGATEENGQFKLIPVRPDWSDGSELLGYVDIKGEFKKGPLIEAVEHAMEHPDLPHFVLLDEMNLARVEYYFSDVLSVMESRRRVGDEIISSYLIDEQAYGQPLRLPENLLMVGTVNMDETTHPFSKKVLDRANTIEFNEIDLENFSYLAVQEEVDIHSIANKQITAPYISLKDVYDVHESLITKVSKQLAEVNEILKPLSAHVGYRVRDEICFYLINNTESGLLKENEAFDFCIMQKILPRIIGSDGRVDQLLNDLFEWLTGELYNDQNTVNFGRYPRSSKKVAEMIGRYHTDGFTSFWIT